MLPIYSYYVLPFVALVAFQWIRQRAIRSRQESEAIEIARKKRQVRDRRRQELLQFLRTKTSQHLSDRALVNRIAQSTATELLEGLRTLQFTYTQVALLFSLRALKIGEQLNCTTEEFFDQALSIAAEYDREENCNLPLKGIPISIKDQINQKDADSSMGMSKRNFQPSTTDGILVRLLKAQGALAGFVRTATLQGMMLPETDSETYGVALNPYDQRRTTGGSSGGEGALVASCGSALGIGTDIGGSIRIPAHFNGIFGFKPTPDRVTYKDISCTSIRRKSGETNIRPAPGPLARCADDLVLIMRAFLQEPMWMEDPALPRQPWREERFQDKKRLTIGYYTNDHWFPPAPACQRAVNEAAEALERMGHKLIPYEPIDINEAVRLFVAITQADGSQHFLQSFENEKVNSRYAPLLQNVMVPNCLRSMVGRILRFIGEDRNALIVESVGSKTAYEYFDLIIDLQIYIERWLEDMRKNHIDLILGPVNGLPAYRHGQSTDLFHSCSYTFLYNVLHFPAGVVPVTVVKEDEQYYEDKEHSPRDRVVKAAKYVCEQSAGLPIGIQLIGWPNDDERVLRVMKELENAIGKERLPKPRLAKDIDIFTD